MTDFSNFSDQELNEALNFHRRQRNMSRGINEAAHARQTQMVRMLEAEEARRLEEAVKVDKKNYSWGKLITVRHGSSHSFPLHPEHQEKIKNLKDGEATAFKDETGSHITASREGDKVHLKLRGVNQKTTVAHSHFTEEVDLGEAVQVNKKNYSWGKMITVRHGSSHSFPLHPEHQEKIKNLKDGESTAFKDETGSHVTASREGDKVHLKLRGVNQKTTVAHSHFTEEVEQIDELSKATLKSYVSKKANQIIDKDEKSNPYGVNGGGSSKERNKDFNKLNLARKKVAEEVDLDEEFGDYSSKKTSEKKSTSAHPDGKPIHHILHKGEVVGTIEPYSAYREKRRPGSRIVSSRTNVTKYSVHFHADKGPTKSADMPLYHKLGHTNVQSALKSAADVHSDWLKKSALKEEVEINEGAMDKNHPIVKEYQAMKKHDIKTLRGMIAGQRRVSDTSEFKTKDHAISSYLRAKHGNKAVDKAFGFNEEVEINEASDLRITKIYNKWPKKATYAVHTPDRKYFKEFDSMEAAKAHHAEKTSK